MTRTQANLTLLAVALIWGSAFIAQAEGMAGVGPLTFTGIRFLLGAAIVLPLAWREWQLRSASCRRAGVGDVLGIGALGVLLMLGAALQQIGITDTSVTNAGFLTALYVPLVPLLAWLLLRTRPHWSVWPTSLGCLWGTWLLAGGGPGTLSGGDLWVIASSLFWALHVLFVGRVAERIAAPFLVACGQFLVCGMSSLIWGTLSETITLAGIRQAMLPIGYAGIISVAIGFTAQVIGQRYAQPADAAIILSAETVFAALFGYLLMGDRLHAGGIAGCALILACIIIVQIAPLQLARHRAPAGGRSHRPR
ncbi:MAG TPA: DMT family transporter [Candidatus Accumulibacter phosphatis]|nr:MAG: putative DMT superfamily transporter inner membrane protein [Candidatus Accumulibacter sp. SK-11]HAY26804.1 EamA/RhaT family transporter [Accumulibacter sp.]HRL74309.1 DMT family transporter [Candidatus Accumulibacter phosphatis]HCN69900.1 EamA/RhaT family transporter [Accumulibacter sp.]HCV13300.1 EamA/RhaT family transporter [Accumulibacter sp.]